MHAADGRFAVRQIHVQRIGRVGPFEAQGKSGALGGESVRAVLLRVHAPAARAPHPTSMTRWRKRVGADRLVELLQETIALAKRKGHVSQRDLERVSVDTTVQEKNITYPTDSKLLYRALEKLVVAAQSRSIALRQSYPHHGVGQAGERQKSAPHVGPTLGRRGAAGRRANDFRTPLGRCRAGGIRCKRSQGHPDTPGVPVASASYFQFPRASTPGPAVRIEPEKRLSTYHALWVIPARGDEGADRKRRNRAVLGLVSPQRATV